MSYASDVMKGIIVVKKPYPPFTIRSDFVNGWDGHEKMCKYRDELFEAFGCDKAIDLEDISKEHSDLLDTYLHNRWNILLTDEDGDLLRDRMKEDRVDWMSVDSWADYFIPIYVAGIRKRFRSIFEFFKV